MNVEQTGLIFFLRWDRCSMQAQKLTADSVFFFLNPHFVEFMSPNRLAEWGVKKTKWDTWILKQLNLILTKTYETPFLFESIGVWSDSLFLFSFAKNLFLALSINFNSQGLFVDFGLERFFFSSLATVSHSTFSLKLTYFRIYIVFWINLSLTKLWRNPKERWVGWGWVISFSPAKRPYFCTFFLPHWIHILAVNKLDTINTRTTLSVDYASFFHADLSVLNILIKMFWRDAIKPLSVHFSGTEIP